MGQESQDFFSSRKEKFYNFDMGEFKSEAEFTQRKEYYSKKISEALSAYPQNFKEFVKKERIIEFGNRLLRKGLSTGYNFATLEKFPIVGTEPLILYSNYIQRKTHFGELIARMEQERIIIEKDITFGVKGTKVIGNWGDPELVISEIATESGEPIQTSESVEAVAIFHPKSFSQAIDIATFLLEKARKGGLPYEIEGSWSIPDTMARQQLSEALLDLGFKEAIANIYNFEIGHIIALRQRTYFEAKGWEGYPILVNGDLYDYFSAFGVGP